MIDDVGLVNMNGRVYDPTIGRFLSADPFIQDVTNSQNLNRYSYVNNNPLSYTDPSGYFFKKLFKAIGRFFKKIWKPLVAITVAIVFGPQIVGGLEMLGLGAAAAPVGAGITGGITNVIVSGRPKSFLSGFGQGIISYGIGSAFKCGTCLGKSVAHGVAGGAFSEIRGDNFLSGFFSAGFTAQFGGNVSSSRWSNSAYNAAIGGVGSVLGGGKFADGAVTSAFVYLFNHGYHVTDEEIQAAHQDLIRAQDNLDAFERWRHNQDTSAYSIEDINYMHQGYINNVRQARRRYDYLVRQQRRQARYHRSDPYTEDHYKACKGAVNLCGAIPVPKYKTGCGLAGTALCEAERYYYRDNPERNPYYEDLPEEERPS